MNGEKFKEQIKEDIRAIQSEYAKNNPLLKSDDYAFNYWILTKLYNIDEEIVEDNITEYSDDGCDCFCFFEESKELYIIQNKYYSNETKLQEQYVVKDFLYRPLNTLEQNAYKRSETLQNIFNKYKNDSDFKIYLNLYVTNNLVNDSLRERFEKFIYSGPNVKCYIDANIYGLDDMVNLYYEDRKKYTKNYSCDFKTINNGTVLNINSSAYKLPNLTDAKYILTPVKLIYEIVKDAKERDYMLFEENIREYLGNKGVNSKIAKTLEDENDRDNFFYYNNGITVICDRVSEKTIHDPNMNKAYTAENPQIVNGCQTVNTVYEILNRYSEEDLNDKFKNTFVMVKLLVLNKDEEKNKVLYQDIVKYNNSQNKVEEKNFAANKQIFINMQKDFKNLGFLLLVKTSDSNKFKTEENFNTYRPIVEKYNDIFGLTFDKLEKIEINLEKLLQILLAFKNDGYSAFTKKSQLLKLDSPTYIDIINYIKNGDLTHNDIVNLYLTYLRAEKEKKNSEDQRTPIPYYLLGFMGRDLKGIIGEDYRRCFRYIFNSKENFDVIYNFYKTLTKRYKINFKNQRNIEYNQMVKTQIDESILENTINDELQMIDSQKAKSIINNYRNHNIN